MVAYNGCESQLVQLKNPLLRFINWGVNVVGSNGSSDNEVQVSTCCGQNICFGMCTNALGPYVMWDILVTKTGPQVLDQAMKGLLVDELECLV